MLSKFNQFPESFKGLIGLTCLTIIIFFTFLILNIFFGPDKDAELKIAEQKKVQETANDLIETLPRGVLTFYEAEIGQKLSAEEYKIICNNITQKLGQAPDFIKRLTRNTHIILQEESRISRVQDPSGGSFYVEKLTNDLSQNAWNNISLLKKWEVLHH